MRAVPAPSASTERMRPGLPLSAEARVLLLAVGGSDEALRADLQHADQERLLALAVAARAVAPLWRRLRPLRAELAPALATRMAQLARVSDFGMLYLQDRLVQTTAALRTAGIEVLLLKGTALAERYYGSYPARPMADIDLLVPVAQLVPARDVLLRTGWRWDHDPALDGYYAKAHHLPPLDDVRGTGLYIEVHGEPFGGGHDFRLDTGEVWAESEPAGTGLAAGARIPHPHHLLLHAGVHFAWSHMLRYGGWRAMSDVAVLARSGRVDWGRFVTLAERTGAGPSCFWTLHLARLLVDAPIPAEVVKALQPRLGAFTLRRLERHFTALLLPFAVVCPSVWLERKLWEAALVPERSGHGSARPWDHSSDYAPSLTPGPAAPMRGPSKLLWHARQLPRWLRYARVVMAQTA